ncbi:MAG: shikimate dehydrogenase [Bacteroidota bacterium]|nr:shikimate dehydrogenase [Bacteroidota bacterium]
MRKFGLIGFPLSHSFSPAFFTQKFEREKISNCTYESYPIDCIDKIHQLLCTNPELEGLNVTIPYKKSVIRFLNNATPAVVGTGACNCIKINNSKLTGHNTDVIGFKKSLSPLLSTHHTRALILGTGGSAAAVEFVLEKLGIDFLFVSRNNADGKKVITYKQLNNKLIEDYKLIINTTPLGMFPDLNNFPDLPYQFLTSKHYLFDLVYNPAATMFLRKGAEMGAITKNGADMLIIQAEESWKIWNE